jgi:SPP1 gp7 family putative phage head morphogenesis protein
MNFAISSLSKYLPGFKSPESALKEVIKKDSRKRISFQLTRRRPFFTKMQQDELKFAIEMARDPERPRREMLYAFYENSLEDGHTFSQLRTIKIKAVGSPFAIFKEDTDEIDEKATKLLMKPWFRKYRHIFHETPFWGHSLVEFQHMRKGKDLEWEWIQKNDIKLFPREHVRPETGEIVLDVADEHGIKYRDEPTFSKYLIEIGDYYDIGLGRIAAKENIWKSYTRSDWSRRAEKIGVPMLKIKTATTEKNELDKLEEMAANFGTNLWVILDDQDEADIIDDKNASGHLIFKDKALFCNEEISKLLVGQTGTTDEKAFVGSAEVHERILGEYVEERMREETEHINFTLFPFLIEHGYPLEGLEFRYLAFMDDEDDAENDGDQDPNDPDNQDPPGRKKKKPAPPKNNPPAGGGNPGGDPVASLPQLEGYHDGCCNHAPTAEHDEELERMLLEAARRMYDGDIPEGQLDPEMYFAIANRITADFDRNYDLSTVAADMPDNALISRVKSNLFSFSGAKNFTEMNLLRDAIFDKDGKIQPWTKYREFALSLNKQYNDIYLAVERNHVIRSGTMAKKYLDATRDSDRFPYMKYVTVGDDRVRPEHAILEGIVRPVNDSFWSQYYPPNAYNCRCSTTPVSESEIASGAETLTDPDDAGKKGGRGVKHKLFRNNPGTSGIVYDANEHPYFEAVPGGKRKQLAANANYGMRPLDQIYKKADKLPARTGGITTREAFDQAWKKLEAENPSGNGFALQSPQINSFLIFDRALKKKLISGNRIGLISEVQEVVINPDEVWSAFLPSKDFGVEKFQVFIKYFKDKPVALLTEINKAKRVRVRSIHNIDAVTRDSQLRRGVLMYRKPTGK